MPAYETETIEKKYHDALVDWQKKNFKELDLLSKNWEKYFGKQTPFALVAKVGKLRSDEVEVGEFKGMHKVEKAGDMEGNMFYSARDIIKAQCSTELGSIQQHRETLEGSISDEAKYSVMRIMAEELRHAYQMFWVLSHDPSWKKPGHGDVASETMEQLLAMNLEDGTHVLDAFNIEFNSFLDNIVFATEIDLVGKYQLEMQRVFTYAPMARSMQPMLSEEGFHMGTGRNCLKEVALNAARQEGDYGIPQIQKAINQWTPRGLEMFGNEEGGTTALSFGFKDKTNSQAQSDYIEECKSILDGINASIVQLHNNKLEFPEAKKAAQRIRATREKEHGVEAEELLFYPDVKFFRKRGKQDWVFKPYDLEGNLLSEKGKPYGREQYGEYLKTVLPEKYVASREFTKFMDEWKQAEEMEDWGW